MSIKAMWIAFFGLFTKEVLRVVRIWPQTLLPSAITMILYFMIFGNLIGNRIGEMQGFTYVDFIAPGLIMMSIITNSYVNVASTFFSTKFQGNIEEMLVSTMSNNSIILGFVVAGVTRGLVIGMFVTIISLFFTTLHIESYFFVFVVAFLTSVLFALAGLLNGIFAKKFDDVSIIPTFVLTPLTYLGGVFYSIHLLSPFLQKLSFFNPILYMVNGFRYSMLGFSDVNVGFALLAE